MDAIATNEDQKQMIKHLQKRVQEHVKEKNTIIEMNEDLEKELEAKAKLLNEVSNYHKKARNEHKEELFQMAKKKEVSDKVIKDLQTENNNFKTEIEKIGLKQLLGELDDLKDVNKKKELFRIFKKKMMTC